MNYQVEKDWTTKAGLRAVVIAHRHRCGYVGVPQGHPLFGVDYSTDMKLLRLYAATAVLGKKSPVLALTCGVHAPDGETITASPEVIFDVHGGLTYAKASPAYPVPSNLWWFGYDCGHLGDLPIPENVSESERELNERFPVDRDGVIRSLDYCIAECESLARQIDEVCASFTPAKPDNPT
jgi:hypothetical protein